MIPSQTLEEFEPFAESGDKVAPIPAKYAQGYLPGEVFPAQHENYLMGKASRCSTQHRAGLRSIEAELNNVVEAGGAEPDDTDDTQVLDAINYLIAQAVAAEREKEMPKGFLWWTSTPPTSPGGNPNLLFPGTTWVRLKDAFIYAAGDNDTVDSNPSTDTPHGSNTRSASDLPKHSHTIGGSTGGMSANATGTFVAGVNTWYASSLNSANFSGNISYNANNVASGQCTGLENGRAGYIASLNVAHTHTLPANTGNTGTNDNMDVRPAYLIKYCWERTA